MIDGVVTHTEYVTQDWHRHWCSHCNRVFLAAKSINSLGDLGRRSVLVLCHLLCRHSEARRNEKTRANSGVHALDDTTVA